MNPDWIWGLCGGVLIGCGAALYLLGNGRIMGASGILGGLLDGPARREKLAFVVGLIGMPLIISRLMSEQPETHLTENLGILVVAGLLVGIGTRLANGCTSGHGVCGISRFSLRGIVATLIYIAAGVVVFALFRHGLGVI